MVGRVMNRTRNLWIMIISMMMLAGLCAAIWILASKSKTGIPQKGVFVYREAENGQ